MTDLKLDTTDIQLLNALQDNASQTNQALAERVNLSAPTCLRRIKRLRDSGLIEREIVVLNADKMAAAMGHGLTALVEITLDQQGTEQQLAFESKAVKESAVQQCYRVSPGPDFVLVVHVRDMPAYLALAQRLFTSDANVRNVKAFFSVKRAKFEPKLPLAL